MEMKGLVGGMLLWGEEVMKKVRVVWGGEKMGCMIGGMELGNGKCVIVDSGRKEVELECIEGLKKKVKI